MKTITKSLLTVLAVTTIAIPVSAEHVNKSYNNSHRSADIDYAKVVGVDPIIESYKVNKPVESCWDERVERKRLFSTKNSYTPEVLGAIVGAAVGNRFGHGSGRDAATVAGAALGTTVARDIKHRRSNNSSRSYDVVQRCEVRDSYTTQERVTGYDVAYKYNGIVYHTTTDSHPGKEIRVRVSVEPA